MTFSRMIATTARILRQLRHDRRTIALLLFAPILALVLLYYLMFGQSLAYNRIALLILGIFPFTVMFLITSIAMLRERVLGTLERLFTTPLTKFELLFAYGAAFGFAATVQASLATGVAHEFLGLSTAGNVWMVVLIAVVNALLGMGLGLFFSAFAQSEFQAVQFMPVVVMPQLLLCGLFVPRPMMAGWLQVASDFMPLTYAVEALQEVGTHAHPTPTLWRDLALVMAMVVVALTLGAATLHRRSH